MKTVRTFLLAALIVMLFLGTAADLESRDDFTPASQQTYLNELNE